MRKRNNKEKIDKCTKCRYFSHTDCDFSMRFFLSKGNALNDKFTYALLLMVKSFSRAFYRFDIDWIGATPKDPWANLRLLLILNHTSLYEPLFTGWVPNRFLKMVAHQGVVPIADKTICRPMIGFFFRMLAGNVIAVSRKRDRTWHEFIDRIHPQSLVVMLPEGRMKRANGLDAEGQPMTVRGGVADLLQRIAGGRLLIAYSGGLHHVQVPGQAFPRLYQTLHMRLENLDISQYTGNLLKRYGPQGFKQAVIQDLQKRRDHYCPPAPATSLT
jgi:1-acyl-sn-glycerol-3-phosphate acyltransferase